MRSEILFMNRYKMGKDIGQGSQGQVKLALDSLSGNQVAIKIFKHRKMNEIDFFFLQNEANILNELKGKEYFVNLIEFIQNEIYINSHGQKELVSAIVMEYANNGSLFDLVSFFEEKYNDNILRIIAIQILDAIEYMQQFSISHRDIKLENIVIDSNFNLKIIDFGLAFQESKNGGKSNFNVGTNPYAPPERFLGEEYSGVKFDIFSLGVMLFFLKFNYYPFINNNPEYSCQPGSFFQFSNNRSLFWNQIIQEENVEDINFIYLVDSLLQSNPDERPSIEEIRNHPFLSSSSNSKNNNIISKFLCMRKEVKDQIIKNKKKEVQNKIKGKSIISNQSQKDNVIPNDNLKNDIKENNPANNIINNNEQKFQEQSRIESSEIKNVNPLEQEIQNNPSIVIAKLEENKLEISKNNNDIQIENNEDQFKNDINELYEIISESNNQNDQEIFSANIQSDDQQQLISLLVKEYYYEIQKDKNLNIQMFEPKKKEDENKDYLFIQQENIQKKHQEENQINILFSKEYLQQILINSLKSFTENFLLQFFTISKSQNQIQQCECVNKNNQLSLNNMNEIESTQLIQYKKHQQNNHLLQLQQNNSINIITNLFICLIFYFQQTIFQKDSQTTISFNLQQKYKPKFQIIM